MGTAWAALCLELWSSFLLQLKKPRVCDREGLNKKAGQLSQPFRPFCHTLLQCKKLRYDLLKELCEGLKTPAVGLHLRALLSGGCVAGWIRLHNPATRTLLFLFQFRAGALSAFWRGWRLLGLARAFASQGVFFGWRLFRFVFVRF